MMKFHGVPLEVRTPKNIVQLSVSGFYERVFFSLSTYTIRVQDHLMYPTELFMPGS